VSRSADGVVCGGEQMYSAQAPMKLLPATRSPTRKAAPTPGPMASTVPANGHRVLHGLGPVTDTKASIPPGFRPLPESGDFIGVNGPLYVHHEGDAVQLGFRVETRHTNPVGNCHGGMMASFCDMLLPISALRTRSELGNRFLPTINLQIEHGRRASRCLGAGRSQRSARNPLAGVRSGGWSPPTAPWPFG
jgi:hypothetical protein